VTKKELDRLKELEAKDYPDMEDHANLGAELERLLPSLIYQIEKMNEALETISHDTQSWEAKTLAKDAMIKP